MIERVKAHLRAREEDALAWLEALVRVNSFTDNRAGGAEVGEMLASVLRDLPGISSVRAIPSERYAPHWVFATEAAEASAEGCIAIVGHLDTVFPPGTFEGFVREGPLARGPGVLDMKGGLVVVVECLRALSREGVLAGLPVRFVVVSDEEVGSPEGSLVLKQSLAGAACALVLEAGRAGDAVITSRKGTGSVHVTASGKASHAGVAHRAGANAIWALCRFVERAQLLTDYDRGVTVNVGTISGGTSKNTVPERAEAGLDFRYERRVDGEALVEALHEATRSVALPGTRILLEGGIGRAPLERTEKNLTLYRAYAACASAAGLGDGEAPLVGGGSDAATTAAMGIPSIDGLGPRGAGFHTKDEHVEVATLVPKAEAIARFLLARCAPT